MTLPYLSGHCSGSGSHARCLGIYAGTICSCICHLTCQACGQPLPAVQS